MPIRRLTIGEVAEIYAGSHATGDLGRRWPDGTLEFVGPVGGDRAAWYRHVNLTAHARLIRRAAAVIVRTAPSTAPRG